MTNGWCRDRLMVGLMVTVAGLAWAADGPGEAPVVWEPPVYAESTISLIDAIQITLEHEPNIRLSVEDEAFKGGAARVATGQFDTTIAGELSLDYTQEELTQKVKSDEQKRRDDLAEEAVDLAEQGAVATVRAGEFDVARQVLASGTPTDPAYFDRLAGVRFSDPVDQANWDYLVASLRSADPSQLGAVTNSFDLWLQSEYTASTTEAEGLNTARLDAENQLRRLGKAPEDQETYKGALSVELRKQYRTGVAITPYVNLSGGGSNFKGKPHDPEFGGQGQVDNYKAVLGFKVSVPLGRGRGVDSTGAAERAAQIDHMASVATTTHTAASSVQNTLVAYWDLVSAQTRVDVLGRSLELNERLLELSEGMVEADELPRVELARNRARLAEVRGSLEDARRNLIEKRVEFARVIGLAVTDAAAVPLAADGFPEVPDDTTLSALDAQRLAEAALKLRADLEAARLTEDASGVLLRAARLDTKRKTDLTVDVNYSGRYEDMNVLEGLEGSVLGNYTGPSGSLGLAFDWPIENNVQLGQLDQRRAQYNQGVITSLDLERTITSAVVRLSGTLAEAARNARELEAARDLYLEALENEIEKYRRGLTTLIDTITTEQRTLDAALAVIGSQQRYAQLLSNLRFESGTLIRRETDGGLVGMAEVTTPPLVTAGL